jgi:hypothetical protein
LSSTTTTSNTFKTSKPSITTTSLLTSQKASQSTSTSTTTTTTTTTTMKHSKWTESIATITLDDSYIEGDAMTSGGNGATLPILLTLLGVALLAGIGYIWWRTTRHARARSSVQMI